MKMINGIIGFFKEYFPLFVVLFVLFGVAAILLSFMSFNSKTSPQIKTTQTRFEVLESETVGESTVTIFRDVVTHRVYMKEYHGGIIDITEKEEMK